jgi:PAS domain S-box-containing protein
VVATDERGFVSFMNGLAESLTGWSASDAKGRTLIEVFVIIDEDTRQPVESPVERVLREGQVVGLANHTILIARDGTEIAIDDSAAPIRAPNGELVGTVLVFRNVSERRADERRREFVARATAELAASLDYERTLATVARLAVPAIADWCAIDMYADGKLQRLAVQHVDPTKIELV